jgi:2-amino-4-hydroxy-6-hydroxymethyldihydropteridine diphosphokinase
MVIGLAVLVTQCSSSMTEKHIAYLGLGSNMGDKEKHLRKAILEIQRLAGDVVRQSAFYVSKPWGFQSENDFVNAVVACRTSLTPRRLLHITQQIEREMGRTEKSVDGHYHDRIIDIDILLYDDLHIDYPDLKIPHPLMQQRDFVMIPLAEVMK